MNADELYGALSARVTATVMKHETDDWPAYFEGLRAVIRCVVTDTAESGLSKEERHALIERLPWTALLPAAERCSRPNSCCRGRSRKEPQAGDFRRAVSCLGANLRMGPPQPFPLAVSGKLTQIFLE